MKRAVVYILISMMAVPAVRAEEAPSFDKDAFIATAENPETVPLGMADCVAMALENNSEIKIQKISPHIEDANVLIQKSRFEPTASASFQTEDNTEQSFSLLSATNPSKTRTGTFSAGADWKWVTGTEWSVDVYATRTRSNSSIVTVNPYVDSLAEVSVTQPILKGFGMLVNKADFLIAKNNRLKSDQDFAEEVMSVLTDVKKAYFNFQYMIELNKVAAASFARVQSLHKVNLEKYTKGQASNVDLLESESELATFEQALIASESAKMTTEDALKLVTNLIDDQTYWNAEIVPTDRLSYEMVEPGLVASIKEAFETRPDYKAAQIDLKNRDISVAYYKNNMLPEVDLVGSFGLNGLAKNSEKAFGHVGSGHYRDWMAGVSVSMPFFWDGEKGNYEKAKLEKQRSLISFKRLEQRIILEVRDAVRQVDTAYRMLGASIKSKEAEEKNFKAQEERFKAGLVSTHDILNYQERLALAQAGYIKSIVDYNVSLFDLAKAKGTTLIEDNITIEE